MSEVLNEENKYAKRPTSQLEMRLKELQDSKAIQIDILRRSEEDLGSEFDEISLIESEIKRRKEEGKPAESRSVLCKFDPSELKGNALWDFRKHFPGDAYAERELGIIDEDRDIKMALTELLRMKQEIDQLKKIIEKTGSEKAKVALKQIKDELSEFLKKS
jgi:hypothetical protein